MTFLSEIQSWWSTLGTALKIPQKMLPDILQSVSNEVKLKATLLQYCVKMKYLRNNYNNEKVGYDGYK